VRSMTSHRAHKAERRPRRGRIRAALTLGAALGLGAVGTLAYWSDQATLSSGPISSGTLDLTLDGSLSGQGGTYTQSTFALANMIPGESVASAVSVANGGSVTLRYTATATAAGGLAAGLTFQVYAGGTATNTGTAAAGNRAGSCTGTSTFGPAVLTGLAQSVIATPRQLLSGAAESVCIVAALPTTANNSLQGTTATATVVFDAKQLGAP
jgi:predicted ribosomally synthesized peptide with SipW-like signal peptide